MMRDIVEDPLTHMKDLFARMYVEMEKRRRRRWSGATVSED